MNEEIEEYISSNMFNQYPDVVGVDELREMLSSNGKKIGRTSAYKLLETKQIYSKKIAREYKIPKISVIKYLLNK